MIRERAEGFMMFWKVLKCQQRLKIFWAFLPIFMDLAYLEYSEYVFILITEWYVCGVYIFIASMRVRAYIYMYVCMNDWEFAYIQLEYRYIVRHNIHIPINYEWVAFNKLRLE